MFNHTVDHAYHQDPRVKDLLERLDQRFKRINQCDDAGFEAVEIACHHFPRGYNPLLGDIDTYLEVLNSLYEDLASLDKECPQAVSSR